MTRNPSSCCRATGIFVRGMRLVVTLVFVLSVTTSVYAQTIGAPVPAAREAQPSKLPAVENYTQEVEDQRPGWKRMTDRLTGRNSIPDHSGEPVSQVPADAEDPKWWNLKEKLFGKQIRGDSGETVTRDADGKWHVVQRGNTASKEAVQEMEEARELFRQEQYGKAARAFKVIAKKYEKTSVAEDALFMRAECMFKMDKLPAAEDSYVKLLTEFPTTRYLPQAVQRVYDIAYFWLEDSRLRSQGQPGKYNRATMAINLIDRTRPMFDTNGRALEAIEKIQQYDPLGPLSDDAGMMAAAHSFTNESYLEAASYYEQVVTDQPQSEHSARAYLLGAQAYMRAYQGPNYDGRDLDDAERLTRSAIARGANLPAEERDRLERDLRVIHLERAKRDFTVAEQYKRMRRYKAAGYCYSLVVKKYPDTDWARSAQEQINFLNTLPQDDEGGFFSPLTSLLGDWGPTSSSPPASVTQPGQTTAVDTIQESAPAGDTAAPPRKLFDRLPTFGR